MLCPPPSTLQCPGSAPIAGTQMLPRGTLQTHPQIPPQSRSMTQLPPGPVQATHGRATTKTAAMQQVLQSRLRIAIPSRP